MIKLIKKGGLLVVSFILSIFGAVGAVDLTDNANAESISKKSNKTITTASANSKSNSQGSTGEFSDYSSYYSYDSSADTQALGVGNDYLYSVRIFKDDKGNVTRKLLRITKGNNPSLVEMDCQSGNTDFFAHANDMAVTTIGGQTHLFVATMDNNIVALVIAGISYMHVATYTVTVKNVSINPSGIHVTHTGTNLQFIFKDGNTIHKSKQYDENLSGVKDIKIESSLKPLDYSQSSLIQEYPSEYTWLKNDFNQQGLCFHSDRYFIPVSGKSASNQNKSVVLVFNKNGDIENNTSFRINSKHGKFEFESVGIDQNGKIFINANVDSDPSANTQYDGVFTFDEFKDN